MTPVEVLNGEYTEIVKFLNSNSQPSLASDANKHFNKALVLASASYFEHEIQKIIIEFFEEKTNNNVMILSFLKNKAISRQYHTYFQWEEKNKPKKDANQFFSLFGESFKESAKQDMKDIDLKESMEAFLEIGHLRNILVHSNFAAYSLDSKTPDEVFLLYKKGLDFISYLKNKLIPIESKNDGFYCANTLDISNLDV